MCVICDTVQCRHCYTGSRLPTSPNVTGELERLVQKVLPRVVERIQNGLAPPFRPAPATKREYPRVLCLDYCKWIDLARAHYGHRDGTQFVEALASIRAAVETGKLLVPILGPNLLEVAEPCDAARRQRTAEFMVSLSGNHSMLNPDALLRLEFLTTIWEQFLGLKVAPFRHGIVRWGIGGAVRTRDHGNLEPESDDLLQQVLNEPEVSVHSMVHATNRCAVETGRLTDGKFVRSAQKARNAGLDKKTRTTAEFWNVLNSGSASVIMTEALHEIGIAEEEFSAWLGSNLIDFCCKVPSLNVVTRLMLTRDENPSHETLPNDLKDLSFLEQAIPHANIVVAEKSWTHFARRTSLDRQYGTTMLSKTGEIPRVLRAQGCFDADGAT